MHKKSQSRTSSYKTDRYYASREKWDTIRGNPSNNEGKRDARKTKMSLEHRMTGKIN